MNNRLFFLLALVGVLLLSTVALAAGQTTIPWDVISGGGGTVSAGDVTISDTIGQPIIGLAQAGCDRRVGLLVWCGARRPHGHANPHPDHTAASHRHTNTDTNNAARRDPYPNAYTDGYSLSQHLPPSSEQRLGIVPK
ncbi:MAG: hypothetical protein GXP38_10375 [Chloroflexi bacterium]|nr:hypothetical protein [Chloroflexota bacterium]